MRKKLLSTLLIVCLGIASHAATSFSTIVQPGISAGQKFFVTFRLENGEDVSNFKAPQIAGCKLVYGPSTSTSSTYQSINGRQTSSSRVEFTFTYKAEHEGTFTVGEASVMSNGKRYTTRPVKFSVGPASASPTNTGRPKPNAPVDINDIDTQTAGRPVNADDVFVRIILSKSSAYEQEAIGCTIKLYTKYSISSFFPTKQPSFDGFLIQEEPMQQATGQMETYNGQNYMTAVLKRCVIFPQQSGKLTINSGNYDLDVVQYDQVNMGFFTVQDPKRRKIQVSSNSASINIIPLPEPKPAGFNGAVGDFTATSRIVGNSFRTNDPATLIYTIKGRGNIKYLKEPVITFPSNFEQYTPKSDITADIVGDNVEGEMNIEYTFVPQSVGKFTISGDKFIYFNPDRKEYITIDVPPHSISVAKGLSENSDRKKGIETRNRDILHIHSDATGNHNHVLVVRTIWYWMAYLALLSALIAVTAIYRRNIARHSDVIGLKLAKAGKVARKRLKLAKKYLDARDADRFYEEMLRAQWGYLSDKLSIPVSQLTRDNISMELSQYGAPQDLIESIITILDECEMARYTPDSAQLIGNVYDRAVDAINRMENLKRTKR